MKKVLITGGAGYKGVILTEALLNKGLDVTILDNFMYGFEPVLGFANNPKCHVVKKDVRNLEESDVKDYDVIYHLAAISGYPACEANPDSAQNINVNSTKRLVNFLSKDQLLVYASTTSMYGRNRQLQDETSPVNPVSIYGVTKRQAEEICLEHQNSISFRFATLFGVSPKMRIDLLLNDFAYKAVTQRSLVLFDSASVRTFLHVRDAIAAYVMAIDQPENLVGEIFNVGSSEMNFSKRDIAEMIHKHIKYEMVESKLDDPDRRDFILNFDKLHALGFKPRISLDEGVKELVNLYSWYQPFNFYKTI